MFRMKAAWTLTCVAQLTVPLLHAEPGPSFISDATFKGSTLAGWHTLGSASWMADGGEIIARGGEGCLILDKPYQDSALYTSFRCTGPCNTGILMRMEKRDGGSTGLMLIHNRSGAGSDILAVHLNGDGKTDVVVATRSGTYIFWGEGKTASHTTKFAKQ
jgi:hypothetical protein